MDFGARKYGTNMVPKMFIDDLVYHIWVKFSYVFILLNQGKEITHFKKTFIKTIKIFQILRLLMQIFRILKLPKITQATGIFQIIKKNTHST